MALLLPRNLSNRVALKNYCKDHGLQHVTELLQIPPQDQRALRIEDELSQRKIRKASHMEPQLLFPLRVVKLFVSLLRFQDVDMIPSELLPLSDHEQLCVGKLIDLLSTASDATTDLLWHSATAAEQGRQHDLSGLRAFLLPEERKVFTDALCWFVQLADPPGRETFVCLAAQALGQSALDLGSLSAVLHSYRKSVAPFVSEPFVSNNTLAAARRKHRQDES